MRRIDELFESALGAKALATDHDKSGNACGAVGCRAPDGTRCGRPRWQARLRSEPGRSSGEGDETTSWPSRPRELAKSKLADAEVANEKDVAANRFGDLGRRNKVARLFQAVETTKLLAESNWASAHRAGDDADVGTEPLLADYATAPAGQPFVSSAIVEANGSFLEIMMALAVLDPPFTAGKHEITADGDRRIAQGRDPAAAGAQGSAEERTCAPDQAPLLLGENFFRLDDRYR